MTDQELLQEIRKGERGAFRVLVERYQRDVYGVAWQLCGNHDDADELAQTVFVKAYKAIDSFRGEAAIKTWLMRIAANSYIDSKRGALRQRLQRLEESPAAYEKGAENTAQAELTFFRQHLERAMEKLSAGEKTAFTLRHLQACSIREIASTLKTSEGTVKSHLNRALTKLRQALAFYDPRMGEER